MQKQILKRKKRNIKKKHGKATEDIVKLMKKHNKTLEHLRAHQIAFAHALRNEHKT